MSSRSGRGVPVRVASAWATGTQMLSQGRPGPLAHARAVSKARAAGSCSPRAAQVFVERRADVGGQLFGPASAGDVEDLLAAAHRTGQ